MKNTKAYLECAIKVFHHSPNLLVTALNLRFTWQGEKLKEWESYSSPLCESHLSHFRKLFYSAVKKPTILLSLGAPVSDWFINTLYSNVLF